MYTLQYASPTAEALQLEFNIVTYANIFRYSMTRGSFFVVISYQYLSLHKAVRYKICGVCSETSKRVACYIKHPQGGYVLAVSLCTNNFSGGGGEGIYNYSWSHSITGHAQLYRESTEYYVIKTVSCLTFLMPRGCCA